MDIIEEHSYFLALEKHMIFAPVKAEALLHN
jgi:hypothetical protein